MYSISGLATLTYNEPIYPQNQPENYNIDTANLILSKISSGYFADPASMLSNVNIVLPENQRFFDYDFRMIARILTQNQQIPWSTFTGWYILLKNSMGWRIVDVPACPQGVEIDDITKKCKEQIPYQPIVEPIIEPIIKAEAGFDIAKYLPYALGELVLLLVLKK